MSLTAAAFPAVAPDDYLDLIRAFPLRVLRADEEQAEAVRVYTRLTARVAPQPLSDGERAYAQALARFIQDYDARAVPARRPRGTPLARLKFVLRESGTTPAQLAGLLGVRPPWVSLLLRGERTLTVAHVRRLARHFKLDAGYFV
jgi:antitoxin component HigA of HigAB toxin-antitoxin module